MKYVTQRKVVSGYHVSVSLLPYRIKSPPPPNFSLTAGGYISQSPWVRCVHLTKFWFRALSLLVLWTWTGHWVSVQNINTRKNHRAKPPDDQGRTERQKARVAKWSAKASHQHQKGRGLNLLVCWLWTIFDTTLLFPKVQLFLQCEADKSTCVVGTVGDLPNSTASLPHIE